MTVRVSGPPHGARGSRIDIRRLRSRAQAILRAVACRSSELSLSLVDDVEMRALNERYRGIDRTTDVLSFSLVLGDCSGHRGHLLGDVVIGIERAACQASARHRGLDDEVTRLLIHGVLHLLGYDHEGASEARRMRAEERRVRRAVCA